MKVNMINETKPIYSSCIDFLRWKLFYLPFSLFIWFISSQVWPGEDWRAVKRSVGGAAQCTPVAQKQLTTNIRMINNYRKRAYLAVFAFNSQ